MVMLGKKALEEQIQGLKEDKQRLTNVNNEVDDIYRSG